MLSRIRLGYADMAVVDLFRVADRLVVEHRDMGMQPSPPLH